MSKTHPGETHLINVSYQTTESGIRNKRIRHKQSHKFYKLLQIPALSVLKQKKKDIKFPNFFNPEKTHTVQSSSSK